MQMLVLLATLAPAAPANEPAGGTYSPLDSPEMRLLADEFRPRIADSHDAQPPIPTHPALVDRFFFGVGAYAASSNTEARLDSPSGIGTTVDLEDVMGLESNDIVPQGIARWRMADRWRLELEYFELNRSNTQDVTIDIEWGDETFPVGTTVETTFDIAVARLSCGYSFFKRQDKELGVALGFHITDLHAELSGGGGNRDEGKLLAPLPVLSLYGQCALTDVWAISGRLDAFRLEYDSYEGHVYSIGLDALCQPWRHFGFGLGWRGLEIEASAENDGWKGEIGTSYTGPIAFISVSF